MSSYITQLENSPEFAEEMLVADVQSTLEQLLEETGCTRADLARRMGVSKARVTQIFSDDQNFTLRLVARAFHALGTRLQLSTASQRGDELSLIGTDEEISTSSVKKGVSGEHGSIRWQFSSADGIAEALSDHRDLLAGLQHAIDQYTQSSVNASCSTVADIRAQIKDWGQLGNNVVPLRKEASHG
jgi:transcriptional regulator with XRE-family HTH domain